MRHGVAIVVAAIALAAAAPGTRAHAQGSAFPCDVFFKNADGSWTANQSVVIPGPNFKVQAGARFRPNMSIMGVNMVEILEKECPAAVATAAEAATKVEITKYADANGSIDAQKLTCDQLANTFQEDADFLGLWYFGYYSGTSKRHDINVGRVRDGIHKVIAYCKSNKDKLVSQAMEIVMKGDRR